MHDWAPDIFGYLDYRAFLGDYYRAAKQNTRSFSYRYFSRRAGYASPNFLKLVIDGKRNLSTDSVDRFADALSMNDDEHRFFSDLVAFAQASSPEETAEAYERVSGSQRFRDARRIDAQFVDYLTHWYYPAIREMAARADFRDEPAWIASQLLPPITEPEAAEALGVLFELGLLVRDDEGRVRRGDVAWTTGHEVRAFAAGAYHRQMLQRAAGSIQLIDRSQRELSATTVCITAHTATELKERIQGFRERLIARCDEDDNPSTVYQLCIQLFPLSRAAGE